MRSTGYEWNINCHNQYSHTVTISADKRQGVLFMNTVTISTHILLLSVLTGDMEYWFWILSQSVPTYYRYQCWQETWSTGYEYCLNQYPHTVTISADRRHGVLVMNTVSISTHILSLSVLTGDMEYWLWILSQSVPTYCHYQSWQEASTGYEWNTNCHNQYSHAVAVSTDRRREALVQRKLSLSGLAALICSLFY